MTPATIIKQARADGVTLALSPTGSIKAVGHGEAVNRWLPVIREYKAELVNELRAANDGAYDARPAPESEARRQRALAMLAERPGLKYAVVVDDPDADPVVLALAIRDRGTCELRIPLDRYDGALLLDLLEQYGGALH